MLNAHHSQENAHQLVTKCTHSFRTINVFVQAPDGSHSAPDAKCAPLSRKTPSSHSAPIAKCTYPSQNIYASVAAPHGSHSAPDAKCAPLLRRSYINSSLNLHIPFEPYMFLYRLPTAPTRLPMLNAHPSQGKRTISRSCSQWLPTAPIAAPT